MSAILNVKHFAISPAHPHLSKEFCPFNLSNLFTALLIYFSQSEIPLVSVCIYQEVETPTTHMGFLARTMHVFL